MNWVTWVLLAMVVASACALVWMAGSAADALARRMVDEKKIWRLFFMQLLWFAAFMAVLWGVATAAGWLMRGES